MKDGSVATNPACTINNSYSFYATFKTALDQFAFSQYNWKFLHFPGIISIMQKDAMMDQTRPIPNNHFRPASWLVFSSVTNLMTSA